jgi:rubrerythrin
MQQNPPNAKRITEIIQMLRAAEDLEEDFESIGEWEGFLSIKSDEIGRLLSRLITESEAHHRMVGLMLKMVNADSQIEARPHAPAPITLEDKTDLELLKDIQGFEKMVRDVYLGVKRLLTEIDLNAVMDRDSARTFVSHLDSLISSEKKHFDLVGESLERVRKESQRVG